MHGLFEERAREHGIHLVWVCHDLCDPRVYTRQAIRDQLNAYMRTVMREEPLRPVDRGSAGRKCMVRKEGERCKYRNSRGGCSAVSAGASP